MLIFSVFLVRVNKKYFNGSYLVRKTKPWQPLIEKFGEKEDPKRIDIMVDRNSKIEDDFILVRTSTSTRIFIGSYYNHNVDYSDFGRLLDDFQNKGLLRVGKLEDPLPVKFDEISSNEDKNTWGCSVQ